MAIANKTVLLGKVLGILVTLPFLMGVAFGITGNPQVAEGMSHYGWTAGMIPVILFLEGISAFLYLIPRTSFIGAILLTGYLGGAIATHLRIGEYTVFVQVILGVVVWASLLMRNPEARKLLK